jgi:hypothetical protein
VHALDRSATVAGIYCISASYCLGYIIYGRNIYLIKIYIIDVIYCVAFTDLHSLRFISVLKCVLNEDVDWVQQAHIVFKIMTFSFSRWNLLHGNMGHHFIVTIFRQLSEDVQF